MAGDNKQGALPAETSEADKAKARAWFKKAADSRERREYDYAIEAFLMGLGFWPEAVDEGHMPLRSLAVQRHQAGGKKSGMMEALKKSMVGKDAKQALLNAEYLLSKDPNNPSYMDGLLKNATKGGYVQTARWVAALIADSLRKEKKPDKNRFRAFRENLVAAAEKAEALDQAPVACWLLEQAVNTLDFQLARNQDEDLRNEQRDLSGKLAIVKGKYQDAESFRDSLHDAEKQKILHDSERVKQGEETFDSLVAAARAELEAHPGVPQKIYALADILRRRETSETDQEAVRLLLDAYKQSRNYNFKFRADDIRMAQLARQVRELNERARKSNAEEDQQQVRLARMELMQTELEIYRERVAKYPTDLALKYRLGRALFKARAFDEAIPVLQLAQADPRNRLQAKLLMGRAFFETNAHAQATDVLRELNEATELSDELQRETLYWLGRALEAGRQNDEAKATYGKLLRLDYNYGDGEVRKRLEQLGQPDSGV